MEQQQAEEVKKYPWTLLEFLETQRHVGLLVVVVVVGDTHTQTHTPSHTAGYNLHTQQMQSGAHTRS